MVAHGVRLEESAGVVVIVAGAIIIKARLGVVTPAGEQVWVIYIARAVRLAEDVVGIPLHKLTIRI